MKQYIMGLITGASLIACAFMFMGAQNTVRDVGRFQTFIFEDRIWISDTATGDNYEKCKILL